MNPSFKYKVELLRVVDGDTVDVMVDLGFRSFAKIRVRLHGIDAPETRTKDLKEKEKGLKCKARLEGILKGGGDLILVSFGVDKYGRSLGALFKNHKDGMFGRCINVNDFLVREGLAKRYFGGKR